MIHTKLAKKVLKKREQQHLTEVNINSMASLQIQVDFMKKDKPDDPGSVCRDCWHIARKLGLEGE